MVKRLPTIPAVDAGGALGGNHGGLEPQWAVPDALQMIDITVIRAHHQAAGAKGDSATGFWPLKRWLHDQDPPPCQCCRPAHENRDHARPDVRFSGVRAGHGRQELCGILGDTA